MTHSTQPSQSEVLDLMTLSPIDGDSFMSERRSDASLTQLMAESYAALLASMLSGSSSEEAAHDALLVFRCAQ